MAHSFQQVTILGNLGRDPEMRYTPGGQAVTTFGVACSRSWKAEGATEWTEETEWFNVVVWGRDAESTAERLRKGSKVMIVGRMKTREYEKDGIKRRVTDLVAERVVFTEKAGGGPAGARQTDEYIDAQAATGARGTQAGAPPEPPTPEFQGDDFDSLPF